MRFSRCPAAVAVLLIVLVASLRVARAEEFSQALDSILPADLKAHVDVLADDAFEGREAGSRGGHAAGGYLVERLQRLGVDPAGDCGKYYQIFAGGYRNVLGILHGADADLRQEYVLVGAHYDHVGYGTRKTSRGPIGYIHNGADDNASGVAGVLEVAEAFSLLEPRPARSVVFAFWDGEEQGLLGSTHWAAHPTLPIERLALALNADMLGRVREDRLHVFGTRTSPGLRRLVSECNAISDLSLDFTWELKANSDHHPIFAKSRPVLMFHSGLHDDYHRPADDADKIDHGGISRGAKLMLAIAYRLANDANRRDFRSASRFETPADQARFEEPAPPRLPRLGVSWNHDHPSAGLLVTRVAPGSAAERSGLEPGDRLLKFSGQELRDTQQLQGQILVAESPVSITVARNEQTTLETLVELDGKPLRLGFAWRADDAEPHAVMLSEVVSGSAAAAAGLEPGDRIYQVNGGDFEGTDGFQAAISASASRFDLLVERCGRLRQILVQPPTAPASLPSP